MSAVIFNRMRCPFKYSYMNGVWIVGTPFARPSPQGSVQWESGSPDETKVNNWKKSGVNDAAKVLGYHINLNRCYFYLLRVSINLPQ